MKQFLVFQGPVSSRSGYGDHARDLVKSLIALDKYDIKIIPVWGSLIFTIRNNSLFKIDEYDDVDIGIHIKDFEKFVKYAIPDLKKEFTILIRNYPNQAFAKVWDYNNQKYHIDIEIVSNNIFNELDIKYVNDFELFIPKKYDVLLKKIYGNYMTPYKVNKGIHGGSPIHRKLLKCYT